MNIFYWFVGARILVGLLAPYLGADPLSGFLIVAFALILILVESRRDTTSTGTMAEHNLGDRTSVDTSPAVHEIADQRAATS